MKKMSYANIANILLGDELYYKFIKEISKENNDSNLADFGKEVVDKCCFLIIMIGMSKKMKLDKVKICLSNEIVEISCKEFAQRFQIYTKEIENNIFETAKELSIVY